MTKYFSGIDQEADVTPENEAAFEAAGWRREDDTEPDLKKKSDKTD